MAFIHPRSNKKTWSPEEDIALVHLVEIHGANNWTVIAQELGGGKRSKQCRERYHNHLQSDIKKGGWTEEEEQKIFELHDIFGNQWAKIAEHFPSRTDNSIKNRYNSMMRSIQHKQSKQQRMQGARHFSSADETLSEPSVSSSLSTISEEPFFKRHPLVPTLSLFGAQPSKDASSEASSSFRFSEYNFSTTGSLLDMTQFTIDSDNLETFRSNSSFEMLRQLLRESEDSSSDDEIPDEWYSEDCCNQYPFSAREEEETHPAASICPFSARLEDYENADYEVEEQHDQFILNPWWEERDLLIELENIEISPRLATGKISPPKPLKISPHTTPRSPFLANMKRLRHAV